VLALLASVVVVAYLIVPGVLFRVLFSLFIPLRAFDRTRTQEVAYSTVVCALPFVVAIFLVWHTSLGRWPFSFPDTWGQRDADYKTILLASFAEPFAGARDEFWGAVTRSTRRHGRILFWYLFLVSCEALLVGFVASRWGTFQPKLAAWPRVDRLLTRFLLAHVSEWHVLLTNFLFPGTTIHADVLALEDRLYRGEVLDYTRDREGSLTGIYLNNAERYDRAGLVSDREKGIAKDTVEYWKSIPGNRLFIFTDKLFTLNIRPQTTLAAASKLVALELDPHATVTVRPIRKAPTETSPHASSKKTGGTPEVQKPRPE
jgi:hypothetical protein